MARTPEQLIAALRLLTIDPRASEAAAMIASQVAEIARLKAALEDVYNATGVAFNFDDTTVEDPWLSDGAGPIPREHFSEALQDRFEGCADILSQALEAV
jgi:hypothetical protein